MSFDNINSSSPRPNPNIDPPDKNEKKQRKGQERLPTRSETPPLNERSVEKAEKPQRSKSRPETKNRSKSSGGDRKSKKPVDKPDVDPHEVALRATPEKSLTEPPMEKGSPSPSPSPTPLHRSENTSPNESAKVPKPGRSKKLATRSIKPRREYQRPEKKDQNNSQDNNDLDNKGNDLKESKTKRESRIKPSDLIFYDRNYIPRFITDTQSAFISSANNLSVNQIGLDGASETGIVPKKMSDCVNDLADALLQGSPCKKPWRKLEDLMQKLDSQTAQNDLRNAIRNVPPYSRQIFCCTDFTALAVGIGKSKNSAKSLAECLKSVAHDVRRDDIKSFFGLEVSVKTVSGVEDTTGIINQTESLWEVREHESDAPLTPADYIMKLSKCQETEQIGEFEVATTVAKDWNRLDIRFKDGDNSFSTKANIEEDESLSTSEGDKSNVNKKNSRILEMLAKAENFAGSKNAVTVLSRVLHQETPRTVLKSVIREQPIHFLPAKIDPLKEEAGQIGLAEYVVEKDQEANFIILINYPPKVYGAVNIFTGITTEFYPGAKNAPSGAQRPINVISKMTLVISGEHAMKGELLIEPTSTFERIFYGKIDLAK